MIFGFGQAMKKAVKRIDKRASVCAKFDIEGIRPHALDVLTFMPGDDVLALPNSITGRELRHYGLARVVRRGDWPYARRRTEDDDDLILTEKGARVRAALLDIPYQDDHLVEATSWEPGCSAFWLDPELWDRTPMLPDGRLDKCWLHLDAKSAPAAEPQPKNPISDYFARQRERENDPSLQCIYKSRSKPCGRCTPCLKRTGHGDEIEHRMVYLTDEKSFAKKEDAIASLRQNGAAD